jgi:hypothetical protein
MLDEIRLKHRGPQLIPLRRQMKTVLDVRIPARLFPAEHRVVEVEEREAIVSLTDRTYDLIGQPHAVDLQPAEWTWLDGGLLCDGRRGGEHRSHEKTDRSHARKGNINRCAT